MTAELDAPVEGQMADGTPVLFRLLTPDDKQRLRDGFQALSPESRYRRFFSPIASLSDEQLAYLTEIDNEHHLAWIAVLRDEPGQPLLGVGRWVRSETDPTTAEAAVTVADDYHRRGLGSALLRLMARSALERGITQFSGYVLSQNEAMFKLFNQFGVVPHGREGNVIEVLVPLPDTIEALDETPAPSILRAAAEGILKGRSGERGYGIRYEEHSDA